MIVNTDVENVSELVHDVFDDGKRKQALLSFLSDDAVATGLREAPASSRAQYHHCYEGGLAAHIVEVYELAVGIAEGVVENNLASLDSANLVDSFAIGDDEFSMFHAISKEQIAMVSILHDIHKVCDVQDLPQYEANILKSGSVSDKVPYKLNKDCFAYKCFSPDDHPVSEPMRSIAWLFQNNKLEIKNGGIRSLALIAAKTPELLEVMTPYEMDAIQYHGGAYETSKFELAGKENPLTIIIHAADMLSSRFGKTRKQ